MKAAPKSKPTPTPRERELDAEKLYQKFVKQRKAPLEQSDAFEIEEHFAASSGSSAFRRVGLLFLAKSGKELIEIATRDGKMVADAVAGIEEAVALYRRLVDDLDRSATRLKFSMVNREDMLELLDAARKERMGDPPEAANG